jgi:hypothetical protein
VDIPPIVTAAATIRLFIAVARTDNVENTTPMHALKTDPGNAAQPESDVSGKTERDLEDARGPIPSDKLGDATKLEDAGPPRWRRRCMVSRPGSVVLLLL